MKVSGSYTIDATREEVWEALNDIDVLARVVPGCQRLDQTGENEFEGTVKIGIQSIRGTYQGRIRLVDIQPPHHYTLIANGKGGNGVVDGTGAVDLEEQADGKTLLKYSGDANIGGTLASVGQRLIDGASKQLINQSLKALNDQIQARKSGASNGSAEADPAPEAKTTESSPATPEPAIAQSGPASAEPAQATPFPIAQAPEPSSAPTTTMMSTAAPARRSVVVPEEEQLKPESVVQGMITDFFKERPWVPWVVVAFLLGFLLGRSQS